MDHEKTLQKLNEIGAIDHSNSISGAPVKREDDPWVNAPFSVVLDAFPDNGKSKPRSLTYAFGASIILAFAFYAGWEAEETAVWLGMLAMGVPFGGLVVASVRTFPKRHP